MMIGTCGHEITMQDVEQGLVIKSYDREGKRCIASIAVCDKCRQEYELEGFVLHNEAEELAWFDVDGRISSRES